MIDVPKNWCFKIYRPLYKNYIILRPKKINYMFLRHHPHHLQPSASKIFIAFPVFTLKKTYIHSELSV